MKNSVFYHSLHSPIGANASFDLGAYNRGGGFSLEAERVADHDVFIGYREGNEIHCFPFVKENLSSAETSFVGTEQIKSNDQQNMVKMHYFKEEEVQREFHYATDQFRAEKISFTMRSRFLQIEESDLEKPELAAFMLVPSVLLSIEIDNRMGDEEVTGFFAVEGIKGKRKVSAASDGEYFGVMANGECGFACRNDDELEIKEFGDFGIDSMFSKKEPVWLMLASVGGILFKVRPGQKAVIHLAAGFYRPGIVTQGARSCRYYYTSLFPGLLEVLKYTLDHTIELLEEAEQRDRELFDSDLSADRKFLVSQAAKSYYRSSMLFLDHEKPLYVVNEGTFMMMNTFDLTIDHMFFEFRYHPWTVKNVLELFAEEYSYEDQFGISFTHDMGTHHTFCEKGNSSYEIPNETGCFSFMTFEQLCNFILAGSCYLYKTNDREWLSRAEDIFVKCYRSLKNRVGSDGIYRADSDRCGCGQEISTYDSLDASLGQARENIYLAVKAMSAFLCLSGVLSTFYPDLKEEAEQSAFGCCSTINQYFDRIKKRFPAILNRHDESFIIPAIEGLCYIYETGLWDKGLGNEAFALLINHLKLHCEAVLEKGICLFDDGGLKLSSTSMNSWMSKIFLCQYVITDVLKLTTDMKEADQAHVKWWKTGCSEDPGIDQIFAGSQTEKGFHYPRGVTNTLWYCPLIIVR